MITIPEEYVAIDIETGGLPAEDERGNKDFSKVSLLRVGAVRCEYDIGLPAPRILSTLDVLVKPAEGAEISPKALKVNGLSLEQLARDGVPMADAMRRLVDFCGITVHLVGHNLLGFDWPVLSRPVMQAIRLQVEKKAGWATGRWDSWEAWDTMAIWKAFATGICRLDQQSQVGFQEDMLRVHREVKSGLDRVAMLFLGRGSMRDKHCPHDPIEDATIAARIFEAMRARGILQEVMGDA